MSNKMQRNDDSKSEDTPPKRRNSTADKRVRERQLGSQTSESYETLESTTDSCLLQQDEYPNLLLILLSPYSWFLIPTDSTTAIYRQKLEVWVSDAFQTPGIVE
ncbi:hypothetical protein CEXT_354761 [Caerostris extrusa]|uniref:Uncharacterized protein n=1 Tax=Caerostris extrusa TaxID=172846 RepID=A0AAV4S437_CAEEX|nr:hypothetical protein CEXT_354761 [Caerostris extrusa]